MFAVVQVGSLQYKVAEGDTIETQKLDGEKGSKVTLDQVLIYSDGKDVRIGQPHVKGVSVAAEVVSQVLGEKLISFKYRRRKTSSWKKGHRQQLTSLKITKISI